MSANAPELRGAALWLFLGLPAAAGCLVVALGLAGSDLAVPVGAYLSGLAGIASGVVVISRVNATSASELFRVLLAAAAVLWGLGQVLNGVLIQRGAEYPTPGDVVSILAGPVAITGLALLPRRVPESLSGLRLTCDAFVAGGVAAALVWRVGFAESVDPRTASGSFTIAFLFLELSVLALVFIAAVRDVDPGMLIGAAGVSLFLAGDVYSQHVLVGPAGDWPWQPMAISSVAWPLMCLGLLMFSADAPDLLDRERPRAERRRTMVAAAVVTALLGAFLGTLVADPVVDEVTIVVLALSFLALGLRDVVVARQGKELLTRLSHMAYLDSLTGLANRRALVDTLHQHDRAGPAWLLTVDLDHFKAVNGLLGHAGGDRLLRMAARSLTRTASGRAEVFRLGGDEFALLGRGSVAGARGLASAILDDLRLAASNEPGMGQVALGASVGIAELSGRESPLRVLAESALALQVAKAEGRGRCVVYAGTVTAESQRRRDVERRLRHAIARQAVTLHFQPVVRLDTGAPYGVEFLARWTDEELGRVEPLEFIDIAEASSLIVSLGKQLLDLALEAASRHGFAERDLTFGVNVSPVQLRVPGFTDYLLRRLREAGLPPDRMVLEVTEQIFVSETDPAVQQLQQAAAAGVKVTIDDFGAGSASLGYLRRMPASILKLDGALVNSMLSDPRSAAIVASVARLGTDTGMDVVAEGIENEQTAQACRDLGIPYGQGWHFARDANLKHLRAMLGAIPVRIETTS